MTTNTMLPWIPTTDVGPSPRRWILPAAMVALLATAWARPLHAQSTAASSPHLILDVEPLLFTQAGYGGSLGWVFGPKQRWTIAAGAFGVDLPDFSRDLFFDGADDLDVRLTWGFGLEARYRLTGSKSGWQVGAAVGAEEFRARASSDVTESAVNAFVTPHFGYLWHPGGGRFFVYPRLVGIFTLADNREQVVDGIGYELQPVVPNVQLRVGFTP
jgi:hypothetical protein